MSIRITTVTDSAHTIVKVDGHLRRIDVDELSRLIGELEGPVALDLNELQSIDREATGDLCKLLSMGIDLRAASPYVDMLLKIRTAEFDANPDVKGSRSDS